MDATDTGVGDYGDLDRHGNYELRRVLNEERCRQFRRHLFLLSLRQIFKAYSIDVANRNVSRNNLNQKSAIFLRIPENRLTFAFDKTKKYKHTPVRDKKF